MKKAFERIKPDEKVKAEVLERVLRYNREKDINKDLEEGIEDMENNNLIRRQREITPKKTGKVSTGIKIVMAAAGIAVIMAIGMYFHIIDNNRAAMTIENIENDDDYNKLTLYLKYIKYDSETKSIMISAIDNKSLVDVEEYLVKVSENDIYNEAGEKMDARDILMYNWSDGVYDYQVGIPIKVYFRKGIEETYPLGITAEAVMFYEGDIGYPNAEVVKNEKLGLSIEYDENKYEYVDNSETDNMILFTEKNGEYSEVKEGIWIYLSGTEYYETLKNLHENVDKSEMEMKKTTFGNFEDVWYISRNEKIVGNESEECFTEYYVINGDSYYKDGSVYVIKTVSYGTKWNSGYYDIKENIELIAKNGIEPSYEPEEDYIFEENGNLNKELLYFGWDNVYVKWEKMDSVDYTTGGAYRIYSKNININNDFLKYLETVTFKKTDETVVDAGIVIGIEVYDTGYNMLFEVSLYDNGVINFYNLEESINVTVDSDVYEYFKDKAEEFINYR